MNKQYIPKSLLNCKLLLTLLVFIVTLVSCKKFLDERPNSKQVKFSVNDIQALLDDYTTMNTAYPSDGETASDNYYLSDADWSALSSIEDRNMYTWTTLVPRLSSSPQWLQTYRVIYNTNISLQQLEESGDNVDQQTFNTLKGSALFFRGYAHFQIAQLYMKPYDPATADHELGIPIRTSPDLELKSERETAKWTYDRILDDLKQAVQLLPINSTIKSRPNRVAAYAALARVYLSMRDYDNAGLSANECLKLYNNLMDYNSSAISKTSNTPFTRFNTEVIFQSLATTAPPQNPTIAKIDPDLLKLYASNDLRRQVFFKENTGANLGTYRFTGNYEPVTSATFFNGLATDEIYLIRAECAARGGRVADAMTDLNTLLANRYSGFNNVVIDNAQDALSRILLERRKELPFRNLRWSDLRRLNKDVDFRKKLIRSVGGATYELPPNDLRYILLIPQEVMNVTDFLQNPR